MIDRECWISVEHPELNEHECLLTNNGRYKSKIHPYDMYPRSTPEQYYNKLSFKSKRKGKVAYDVYGNVCEDLYPVIVNIDEYEAYLIGIGRLNKCRQETIDRMEEER